MCEINKKICVKSGYRQKLFDEFIHFGYTRARIREYKFLREREMNDFGEEKYKNINLGKEFRQLFIAVTLLTNLRGKKLEISVLGDGCGYFAAELFEYRVCNILINAIKNSENGGVSAVFNISHNRIRLTIFYKGQPITDINDYAFQFTLLNKVVINYSAEYIPTKGGQFRYAWEWMGDRLSDLNVALTDI